MSGAAQGVPDVLRRIVARRRQRFGLAPERAEADSGERAAAVAPQPARAVPLAPADNAFLAALASHRAGGPVDPDGGRRRGARIIAEVKMGSPRIGPLAGRVDPLAQARLYAAGGAAALSVVVEPDFFHGSYELLAECRAASGLPAIAKDFLVDPRQLDLARAAGADAVLLIAALYTPGELYRWARLARTMGLAPLVETHGAADLDRLAAAADRWELVGINHRDLRTFDVDLGRSAALLPRLPAGAVRVAESGIAAGADVARLAAAGFDAFLVGESLLLAADPPARLAELIAAVPAAEPAAVAPAAARHGGAR